MGNRGRKPKKEKRDGARDYSKAIFEEIHRKKFWHIKRSEVLPLILLPLVVSTGTLVAAPFASDAVDAWRADWWPPCLEIAGEVSPIITYEYPPPGADEVMTSGFDLPNGSNYVYAQAFHNSGARDLVSLTLRLNLPGVPVSVWSNRNETNMDVGPVTVLLSNDDGTIRPDAQPVTRDPRALRGPDFNPAFQFYMRRIGSTAPDRPNVAGLDSDWAKRIVAASGAETASYQLPVLHPGETWKVYTLYFGNRTAESATGSLVAGVRVAGSEYYNSYTLTAFQPQDNRTRENPGGEPWREGLPRDCDFGP